MLDRKIFAICLTRSISIIKAFCDIKIDRVIYMRSINVKSTYIITTDHRALFSQHIVVYLVALRG